MSLRLPLVVCAAVLLTACKGETTTTTTTNAQTTQTTAAAPATPAATPASRDVCAMLSAEELKSAANLTAAEGKASKSGGADVCSWFGDGGKALVVQVFPYASSYDDSREAFEGLYNTKASDLSGVGDKAFFMNGKTGPMATTTLVAAKGTTPISVQVMGGSGDDASRKTEASRVATLLLSKL
jgi:hypothetical protein